MLFERNARRRLRPVRRPARRQHRDAADRPGDPDSMPVAGEPAQALADRVRARARRVRRLRHRRQLLRRGARARGGRPRLSHALVRLPALPMVLGVVLGFLVEFELPPVARPLAATTAIFLEDPVALGLLICAFAVIAVSLAREIRAARAQPDPRHDCSVNRRRSPRASPTPLRKVTAVGSRTPSASAWRNCWSTSPGLASPRAEPTTCARRSPGGRAQAPARRSAMPTATTPRAPRCSTALPRMARISTTRSRADPCTPAR